MSKLSLFTQIGMIVVAVIITVLYIKPTVANIRSTEETTATYSAEADKVSDVNKMLSEQVAKVNSVTSADGEALKRYMPDSVDEVAVMKDLSAIFTALNIPLTALTAGTAAVLSGDSATDQTSHLTTHSFTVGATMSYPELKKLLSALEVNNYLLQIDSLKVTPSESGDLAVSLSLSTFSRATVVDTVPGAATSDVTE